jgi:hypothetical protein
MARNYNCNCYSSNDVHPILFYSGIIGGIITTLRVSYDFCNKACNWYNKKNIKEEDHQTKLIKLIENATEQLHNNTLLINKILESNINNDNKVGNNN